jgi:hypothetical protein
LLLSQLATDPVEEPVEARRAPDTDPSEKPCWPDDHVEDDAVPDCGEEGVEDGVVVDCVVEMVDSFVEMCLCFCCASIASTAASILLSKLPSSIRRIKAENSAIVTALSPSAASDRVASGRGRLFGPRGWFPVSASLTYRSRR